MVLVWSQWAKKYLTEYPYLTEYLGEYHHSLPRQDVLNSRAQRVPTASGGPGDLGRRCRKRCTDSFPRGDRFGSASVSRSGELQKRAVNGFWFPIPCSFHYSDIVCTILDHPPLGYVMLDATEFFLSPWPSSCPFLFLPLTLSLQSTGYLCLGHSALSWDLLSLSLAHTSRPVETQTLTPESKVSPGKPVTAQDVAPPLRGGHASHRADPLFMRSDSAYHFPGFSRACSPPSAASTFSEVTMVSSLWENGDHGAHPGDDGREQRQRSRLLPPPCAHLEVPRHQRHPTDTLAYRRRY